MQTPRKLGGACKAITGTAHSRSVSSVTGNASGVLKIKGFSVMSALKENTLTLMAIAITVKLAPCI